MRRHLSFANVVSVIALFIALGGGAYAVSLDRNSVKSKQIKDGQVRLVDLALNSVDSSRIVDGAIGSGDIADGAVQSAEIADGAVQTAEIADGAVQTAEIGANAVDGSKVGPDSLSGADIDEASLLLPAGSVGPAALGVQPHVDAARIATQSVASSGTGTRIVFDSFPENSGFTTNGDGGLTAQVPGIYLLTAEVGANANDWGVSFSNGETTAFGKQRETLTRLVRLDAGTTVRLFNAEAIGFTLNGGTENNPAAQVILVRVGS